MKYPNEVQQELLHGLLNIASKTETGKINDFESIKNYTDFKNRLPIVGYEYIVPEIERCRKGAQNIFWPTPIKWFAKSSGTTNAKSKYIPIKFETINGLFVNKENQRSQNHWIKILINTIKRLSDNQRLVKSH